MVAKRGGSENSAWRADTLMVYLGLAESRVRARALILSGRVYLGLQRVEKPGKTLPVGTVLRVEQGARYVGRGGEKMEAALRNFDLNVKGLVALDLGASTGGFTDCLLQHGVASVYAVDVGYGQLATSLREDSRVVSMERTNARHPFDLPELVGMIVADVSFISLRLVLPSALKYLLLGGAILALVKPQFEAHQRQVRTRGIIRDPIVHAQVIGDFCLWAIEHGLRLLGIRPSVLEGANGNREFFVLLQKVD